MPLVSVVVPTHNRPEMLAEALASVGAQTFTNYEVIVISNGESVVMADASREIVSAHRCRFAAPCTLFKLAEGSLPAARNFGIAHASGEWIAFLDDDDLWEPTKLERQLAEAERTGADMVACDYVEFYPDGRLVTFRWRVLSGWSYTKAINHGHWCAPPSAVMVRKRVLDTISGFDPRLRWSEDMDAWRRISWRHAIHQMDEALMRLRRGHTSMMHTRFERTRYVYDLRLFIKMRRDTPPDLRSTLPSATTYVLPRLIGICSPRWILTFLHWFGPRRRWLNFRRWLSSKLRRPSFGS